jgi:hypothetical protein
MTLTLKRDLPTETRLTWDQVDDNFANLAVWGGVSVKKFGAKGDGIEHIEAGSMTADSTTLVVTGAEFTEADTGKDITILGAEGGDPAKALSTKIASVTNATTVETEDAAAASVADVTVIYGTDDTDAFKDTIRSGAKRIVVPPGMYILNNNKEPWSEELDINPTPSQHVIPVPTGVVLQGSGAGNTHLRCIHPFGGSTSTQPRALITLAGDRAEVRDVRISGVFPLSGESISASNPNQLGPSSCVQGIGVSHTAVRRCWIEDAGGDGYAIRSDVDALVGCYHNLIEDTLIERCRNGSKWISRHNLDGPQPQFNKMLRCVIRGTLWWRGMECRSSSDNIIDQCLFEGGLGNTASGQIAFEKWSNHNIVRDTIVRNGHNGIDFTSRSLPSMYNKVINCRILGHTSNGVVSKSSHFNEIIDSEIAWNGNRAFYRFDPVDETETTIIIDGDSVFDWQVDDVLVVDETDIGIVLGVNTANRYLFLSVDGYSGDFAVGDTVTSGEKEGKIVFVQEEISQGITFKNCDIHHNGFGEGSPSPAVNSCIETIVEDCDFHENAWTCLSIGAGRKGRVRNNRFRGNRPGVTASTANHGDIVISVEESLLTQVVFENNDAEVWHNQPLGWDRVGEILPAQRLPRIAATGQARFVTTDTGAFSPTKAVVWANDGGTRESFAHCSYRTFMDRGARYLDVHLRVKDDGTVRSIRHRATDEATNLFTNTSGGGEWEWVVIRFDLDEATAADRLRLQVNNATDRVLLIDSYRLELVAADPE